MKEKVKLDAPIARVCRTLTGARRGLTLAVLGCLALLGVTQAAAIRNFVAGSVLGASSGKAKAVSAQRHTNGPSDLPRPATAQSSTEINAPGSLNLVRLIDESETIVRGSVRSVTDGFDRGVPYTEVTLNVSENFRGHTGEELKFRQFGLTKPRTMPDGYVNLNVTPAGWATYAVGEDIMVFLFKTAPLTGLRSTIGLGQGKFNIQAGNMVNQSGNIGLFQDVSIDAAMTNQRDERLLSTTKGPVNAESFLSLVRRAVQGDWIRGGVMSHAR